MRDVNLLINNGVNVKKSLELFGDMATYDDTLGDFLQDINEKEMNKVAHPSAIYPIKLENRTVSPDIGYQIIVFIIFFMAIFALSSIAVSFIEQNVLLAVTGSIATLSNAGPGLDNVIGPVGSYASLKIPTKLIFMFNMVVGRLEIIPFLALLQKDLWQFKK